MVIEVPRADRREKPVYIGNDPYMGSYRRNGEGDYRCTRDEVDKLLRDAAGGSQDIQVFGDMGMEVLDGDTVERYRQEYLSAIRRSPRHSCLFRSSWKNWEPWRRTAAVSAM